MPARALLASIVAMVAVVATGQLAVPPASALTQTAPGCSGVLGDIDGNGQADLVATTYGSDEKKVRPTAQVILQPSGQQFVLGLVPIISAVAVADVDADGCADIISGNQVWFGQPPSIGGGVPDLPQISLPRPSEVDHGMGVVAATPGRIYTSVFTKSHKLAVLAQTIAADRSISGSTLLVDPSAPDPRVGDGRGEFGAALAAEGNTVLVGSPSRVVNGKSGAGALSVFTASVASPLAFTSRVYTQNSPGVPDKTERGDLFAQSLALRDGRVVVGVPGEDLPGDYDQGLVQLARWDESSRTMTFGKAVTQNSRGVPGVAEFEDHFGRTVAIGRGITANGSYDAVIGAPDERVGRKDTAGYVDVVSFDHFKAIGLSQNNSAIPGSAELGDEFGGAITVLPDSTTDGTPIHDRLAIAARGQSTKSTPGTGVVQVSTGYPVTRSTWVTYHAKPRDAVDLHFGWQLAA